MHTKNTLIAGLMEILESLEFSASKATEEAAAYFEKAAAKAETETPGYYDAKSRAKDAESMAYREAIHLIRDLLK